MGLMRTNYTFRINPMYLNRLKQIAREDNRSTSNYIEMLIKKHVDCVDMPCDANPVKQQLS